MDQCIRDQLSHRDLGEHFDLTPLRLLDLSGDLAGTFDSNYSEFPKSSFGRQFAIGENALEVLVYSRHGDLEQLREMRPGEPDRFVFEPAFDARAAVLGLVEDDFGVRRSVVRHGEPPELAARCPVQQRLLQLIEDGELFMDDVFETPRRGRVRIGEGFRLVGFREQIR